jgi:hypothetical protein
MFIYPVYYHNWRNISTIYIHTFVYITRLTSNEIFSPSNKVHREVVRAKDLSIIPMMCHLECDAYNLVEISRRFRETCCLGHGVETRPYTSAGLQGVISQTSLTFTSIVTECLVLSIEGYNFITCFVSFKKLFEL